MKPTTRSIREAVEIRHFHLFCGLGGGAKGFNRGRAEVGMMRAKFRCIGGVDNDAAAVRDFTKQVGVQGTCLDLFDRDQYIAFHSHQPPADWKEAGPEEIRRAANYERPHIVFLSAPCKGFSGLLSESKSRGEKYQALNRLTLRGVWLMLEAWSDDPPELVIFENVPRIATRGRGLLDRIGELFRHYGYAVAETEHDCGEVGGLAQHRKRFLMVARHMAKVPPFLYEPPRRPLRNVGDILSQMPLPGDLRVGPMHALPNLQWKTWVRLAFVEAGSDWRSLNKLRVVDGKLADYLIVPEMHRGTYGVTDWSEPAGTVTGNARPVTGKFAVADPRAPGRWEKGGGKYGVTPFDSPAGSVIGASHSGNGAFAVADPRQQAFDRGFGICRWSSPAAAVQSRSCPSNGEFSVADPRLGDHNYHTNIDYVTPWTSSARTVTGAAHVAGGALSVADPRLGATGPRFNNVYRIVRFDETSPAVTGGGGPTAGGLGVADPRPALGSRAFGKFAVAGWDGNTGTVICGDDSGAYAVADPRVLNREPGDHYLTGGHYGVVPWTAASGAVSGAACHDNGPWSVQDPRMPVATEKMTAVIRSLDGTWHRPFTTLELAALQSLYDPQRDFEGFDLDGTSDSGKRERIGNAVPPDAAEQIAGVMGETLLLAWSGVTFQLSSLPIWVRPIGIALAVKTYDGGWR